MAYSETIAVPVGRWSWRLVSVGSFLLRLSHSLRLPRYIIGSRHQVRQRGDAMLSPGSAVIRPHSNRAEPTGKCLGLTVLKRSYRCNEAQHRARGADRAAHAARQADWKGADMTKATNHDEYIARAHGFARPTLNRRGAAVHH